MDDLPPIALDFLSYMETIQGKSDLTTKEYAYDFRTFFRFMKMQKKKVSWNAVFDEIAINDVDIDFIKTINLSDLYAYMSYVSRDRENNASSRARKVASIKSFYKYLFSKAKLINENPAAELESPKIMKRLPKHLNLDESIQLLEAVEGKHEVRDYAILTVFLNCGLRLSELVGININKIRDEKLTVVGKGDKERTIYLNKACVEALDSYLEIRLKMKNVKDKEALFLSERNQRISNKTVQYIVKKYIKMAGLDPERYSTHKLRHTAATLMYQHGHVDIRALQEILGHESISTTEIYTHVDNSLLKNAADNNPLSAYGRKKGNKNIE